MVEEEFDGKCFGSPTTQQTPGCSLEPEMFVLLYGLNTEQNWLTDCLRSLKTPFF